MLWYTGMTTAKKTAFSGRFSSNMWEINIGSQLIDVLYALLSGIILCLFFDLFRAVRKSFRHGFFVVFAEDLFFWIITTLYNFLLFMARSDGKVRGYILLFEVVGFAVCRMTLSRIWLSGILFILRLGRQLNYMLAKGIRWLNVGFGKIAGFFIRFYQKSLKKTGFLLKKLLKHNKDMLYTD